MKSLLVFALIAFGFTSHAGKLNTAQAPIANAGPAQTIYLTQTNTVTLNGSASSGDTYQWKEVSTDYKSGATITSPNSAVTTVTGLPQGVFYFQLAVTSGGVTATDEVAIRVDYDVAPNGTLLRNLPFSSISSIVNDRHDTVNYIETEWYNSSTNQSIFFDRCRLPGQYIDPQLNKFYSIIEDGYGWNGNNYARSEMSFGTYFTFDTAKTYCMEWKGYFPQDWSYLALNQDVAIFMQIHANSDAQHMLGTQVINQGSGPKFVINDNGQYTILADLNTFVNQTHTIRVIFREGSAGTGAYYKVLIDGVQKYLKNVGMIGGIPQGQDYPKIATLYDYGRAIVDPSNKTRGRKFSMVTEQFNVFLLNDKPASTPTANAGSNQTITLPTNSVNLSGSASESGGSIATYNWTKSSGPAGGTITSPNSQSTSVTGLVHGTYIFQLKVTDNNGATATSNVQVTVNPLAQNILPKASAGADQTITLPTTTANLTGSGSDSDGTITSYLWSKTNGPSGGTIASPSSATTTVSNLQQGEYTFQLKVTDNSGGIGTDTVHVTVIAATNQAPIANAGTDQTITLPVNSVSLIGKGTDSSGTIASYHWAKISGNSCSISNPDSSNTSVTGLTSGTYQFELTVTDNLGATGKDTVLVTVKAGAIITPTASAGADQTITLPTNSVTLKGSGVESNGVITSYLWTKISGPSSFSIADSVSATTNVSALVQGTYVFQLKVADSSGASGKDTVQITVNAANNIPPTANAGADQTITLPANSVTLAGSGNDSDGTVTSYLWTKISGPAATIANATSATTNVTGLAQGTYQFELKVTDNNGASGKDTVQITVNAANNIPPTANAGADQTITLPADSVTLVGSGNDSDGTVTSYLWTKISGPAATIANATSATTNVTGLAQGTYQFELKVTDNNGASGKDTVQITVNAANNIPPTANAGADQTITLPADSVTLVGSGNDSDGTVTSYLWTKISGPAATIANATSATTNVTGLAQGTYQFELKVTDNNGASGKDTVQITVNPANNIPPTANAGADQTITLPTNSVVLSGSGNDPDGTIASYSWSKISGPSSFKMSNSSSAKVNVKGLVEGTYQFELKVTDDKGAIGRDTTQINVLRDTTISSIKSNNTVPSNTSSNNTISNNIAPTANAGADQTITLPTNSVILSGSGNDPDGTIASYSWTRVSGPSSFSITNSSSSTVNVTGLVQGTYQFELKVTDNKGAIGRDTVQVTVLSVATTNQTVLKQNIAPTANAGSDKTITLPTNSVSLSGRGTDPDGTIVSYNWTKISGPSATIVNASSSTTDVTGLLQGSYQFELEVTDNDGAIGKDTLMVNVLNNTTSSLPVQQNIAPTANAGSDITTVSSVPFITINGSGTDPDGQIISYAWKQVSGPSTAVLSGADSATVRVQNLKEGTYQFELQVTDDKGAIGKDTVNVTVALERTSSQNVVVKTSSLKVYPNPVHDIATVQITTPQVNTNIKIVISDINGKTVYANQFVASSNYVTQQINMSNLIKGTYIISVYFDGMQQQSVKVVRL